MSALLSFTIKLGLASTKCGSSVGRASVVSSILSPPISFAIDARSGVVATTFNFAWATAAQSPIPSDKSHCRFITGECFIVSGLKLMRGVRAQQEFELQTHGVLIAEQFAVIVVVLQADFRELARIERQHWGDARAFVAKHIERIVSALVAIDVFAAQPGDPARLEPPEHLRIKSP